MRSTIDPKMAEHFCEFSASSDTLSTGNVLNESYTISKNYEDKKLAVIYEENSECGMDTNICASVTNLSECENMSFVDQGIKLISVSPEYKKDVSDDITDSSDESLGLLPDLIDLTCDGFYLYKEDFNKDLNTTVNISDKNREDFNEFLSYELKHSGKEFISPSCNKINTSGPQTESPVYFNQSMPKYASTPKHETSYSDIIDEQIDSPQNMPDFHLNIISHNHNVEEKDLLNKTVIIESHISSVVTNIPISTCLNSDKNMDSQQNILNITCNMTKPVNTGEIPLNKTFEGLNVLIDKCVLPSIISNAEQYEISKSNIPDTIFEHHNSTEFDPDLSKKRILNLTSPHVAELDTIGTVSRKISENTNSIREILNTTVSFPSSPDKTQLIYSLSKNTLDVDENYFQARAGDILNTTYEKIDESLKNDVNSEKLKCITNLEENKLLQLESKTVTKKRVISFSAKNVASDENGFKRTEWDRNVRRSIGCFGKTNVTRTDPVKQTYRRSLSIGTCAVSKVPEIKKNLSVSKTILPKHARNTENKSSLVIEKKEVNKNHSYLKNETVKSMSSKDIKCVSKIKLNGNQQSLLNTTINLHENFSNADKTVNYSAKISEGKSEDIKSVHKVNLKDSEESLLNTTVSLHLPITHVSKTVPKKPRKSLQISDTKTLCLDHYELPFKKGIKSVIPSFQKRVSTNLSQTRMKEMSQESNDNKTFVSSNKTVLKEPLSMEEKFSRLSYNTSSQKKNFQSDPHSSSIKPLSNMAKPHSTITGIRPPATSRKSLLTQKTLKERSELAAKANTALPAGSLPSFNRILLCQKSKQQGSEIFKKFQSTSKIPSISQFSRREKN